MGQINASVLRQVIDNASLAAKDGDPVAASQTDVTTPGGPLAANPPDPSLRSLEGEAAKGGAEQSAHLQMLFDNAPVAMAMFDANMRYIVANRRWLEDFKLQSTPIVGRSQYALFPSLHPGWRHVYDRALNGQVVRSDRDAITQDGKPIVYRWEVRPWRHADTKIGGVMITCTRLYANPGGGSAMENLEKPAAAAAEATGEGLWQSTLPLLALDENGLITRISRGAGGLFLSKGLEEGTTKLWEALGEREPSGPTRRQVLSAIKSVLAEEKTQAVVNTYQEDLPEGTPSQWVLSRVDGPAFGLAGQALLAIGVSGLDAPPLAGGSPLIDSDTKEHLVEALAPSAPLLPGAGPDELARLVAELKKATEAEQLSKVRETRLRAVLDLAPCGMLVLDERARPIYHNQKLQTLLGRPLAENQSVEDWIAEGSRDDVHREEVTRLWRENVWRKQLTVALTLASADELLKDIEMHPVSLPGGGLMVMLHDVTDSRRGEEMLRSTEAKFRTLVHENPQPVILTDRTGAVFDANPAAEALLGYTRAELRRMGMERWLEADSLTSRALALREMVQHSDRSRMVPVVILNREGNPVNANLRLAIVPDVQGEPMFTVQFLMPVVLESRPDVPAQPIRHEEDFQPESFLVDDHDEPEMVTHTSLQDLLATDVHGKIITWSADADEQFGYTATQMVGRGLHSIFRPSDATGFYGELSMLAAQGNSTEVGWTYYHGEEGRMEGRFIVAADSAGGSAVSLKKVLEVTVPVERPVVQQKAVVDHEVEPLMPEDDHVAPPAAVYGKPTPQALDREKLLLGETHHRVKNHLQIITSMLNLQISTLHNEEARDALRSSQNRVRSIAALHQHLYQVSTGESGEFITFARDLIGHLRDCFEVSEERVRVEMSLPDKDVPEEWLMPLALSLNEMVSNAFKHAYTDDREGDMRVDLTWDDEQGQLTVTDDGAGLPEDFDDHHPSGMGLKILRVFAGQLGGEIKVSGVNGGGTEFKLCFPVGVNQY